MSRQPSVRLLPSHYFYGWVIVASAFLINVFLTTYNPVIFSFFIAPMSDDLDVGSSALAWALTMRLIAGGSSALFLGMLMDRFGARWMGVFSGLVGGIGLAALGFVQDIWQVYLI